MSTLWFERRFVEPILAGTKRSTVRCNVRAGIETGTTVKFSVGPREPFAQARITSIVRVTWDELAEKERAYFLKRGERQRSYLRIRWTDVRRMRQGSGGGSR